MNQQQTAEFRTVAEPFICGAPGCDFETYNGDKWDWHQLNTGHDLVSEESEDDVCVALGEANAADQRAIDEASDAVHVCIKCGETMDRISFYKASCTPAEEYDGQIPGPAGVHVYETVTRSEYAGRVG